MKNKRMKIVKPSGGDAVHGHRLEQIRKDLKNKELSDKEKMLRYSSHLEWFIKKVQGVFAFEQMMKKPNIWNRSAYTHGQLNAIITIIGLFLEDTGKIPLIKRPEKYLSEADEELATLSADYITQLEEMITQIIERPISDPEWYSQWEENVLDLIENSYLQTDQLVKIRERMKEATKNQNT